MSDELPGVAANPPVPRKGIQQTCRKPLVRDRIARICLIVAAVGLATVSFRDVVRPAAWGRRLASSRCFVLRSKRQG